MYRSRVKRRTEEYLHQMSIAVNSITFRDKMRGRAGGAARTHYDSWPAVSCHLRARFTLALASSSSRVTSLHTTSIEHIH